MPRLGGAAGLLLLTQMLILRWGLRPLRQVADDLRVIERGERDDLTGRYPAELLLLTDGLNALLRHERAQLLRQRNALADLAHSIKTPLAVLRNAAADVSPAQQRLLTDAVDAIDASRAYQARRAAAPAAPRSPPQWAWRRKPRRIMAGLDKVMPTKGVAAELDDPHGGQFAGDAGDLYELLWLPARQRLQVVRTAGVAERAADRRRRDWPAQSGTDARGRRPRRAVSPLREAVLERGARADRRVPGQGIGLAVVRDIAIAYGGSLDIDDFYRAWAGRGSGYACRPARRSTPPSELWVAFRGLYKSRSCRSPRDRRTAR